jgi:hypothetical protein
MWRYFGYVGLAHSLKRDIGSAVKPLIRFTNVDDVTQDHANQRAIGTIAKSVFVAPHPFCHNAALLCFFGAICGKAD